MTETMSWLVEWGRQSLAYFWIPLAAWSLLVGVLFLVVGTWKKARSQWRYLASTALLLSLPIGFASAPLAGSALTWIPTAKSGSTQDLSRSVSIDDAAESARVPAVDSVSNSDSEAAPIVLSTAAPEIPQGSAASRPAIAMLPLLGGLASILVFVLGLLGLVRLVANQLALLRLARRLTPVRDTTLVTRFEDVASKVGLRKIPRLMTGPSDMAPMTFGWLRPVVALPADMIERGADSDDVGHSIVHELTHVRRGDFAVGTLARLAAAPFLWHPLVGRIKRHADVQRELACDADVVEGSNVDRTRYAATLLNVSHLAFAAPGLSISNTKKVLAQRIKAMNAQHSNRPMGRRPKLTVVLALVFLLLPAALLACSTPDSHQATPTPALEDQLARLEAEMSYLNHEILEIGDQRNAIEASVMQEIGTSSMSNPRVHQELGRNAEYSTLGRRSYILEQMRDARRQHLEEVRMAVVVNAALADR